jgi:hypothetical protein
MGLQIRQKLSSLWPILVKPSVFAFDAPSPTGSWNRQLTALFPLPGRMKSTFQGFDGVHLMGERAMHPSAPRSGRHAALLLLAGRSPLRRHALPGTPITALSGASNYRF